MIMTNATQPPELTLSAEEIASIMDSTTPDPRGDQQVRPTYLRPLSVFGFLNVGVLTHEDTRTITVASIPIEMVDGQVIVYDDTAPQNPRPLTGRVDCVRAASRPSDQGWNLCLIDLPKREIRPREPRPKAVDTVSTVYPHPSPTRCEPHEFST